MCFQKDFLSALAPIPENHDSAEIRQRLENATGCRTCPKHVIRDASGQRLPVPAPLAGRP